MSRMLNASGNISVVGVWETWVTCSAPANSILVDVVRGIPTKAILDLDSFRVLKLCVVYSGDSFELTAGGWQIKDLGFIRISALADRTSQIGGVCLSQDPKTPGCQHNSTQLSLCTDSHDAAQPRLHSMADDDDSPWELEAVHALQLCPSTFSCPNTNRPKRGRHTHRHLACLALPVDANFGDSPLKSRDLTQFPETYEALLQMCDSTEATLSQSEREQLKQLCFSCPPIWIAGDRPPATHKLDQICSNFEGWRRTILSDLTCVLPGGIRREIKTSGGYSGTGWSVPAYKDAVCRLVQPEHRQHNGERLTTSSLE
ncbi:hypothetical protein Efla_004627 [Eimeria flavescens]